MIDRNCKGSGEHVGSGFGLAASGPHRIVPSHQRRGDKFVCPVCGRAFRLTKGKVLPRHLRHPLGAKG